MRLDLGLLSIPCPQHFNYRGKHRKKDDRENHQGEVLLDDGRIRKEVACKYEQRRPQNSSDDVVGNELGVSHFANAGDKWGKRSDYRHEARDDDCLAAVTLVELVGLHQVFALDEPLENSPGSY